jgi:hypothetical protein
MISNVTTWPDMENATGTGAYYTMDATGERIGHVHPIYKAGNIATVSFYVRTVSTSDTLKVSLQTVDTATGLPSGTILPTAGGNNAYATIVVSSTEWKTVTLTESAPVTQGQVIAMVLEWNSYVAGSMTFYAQPFLLIQYQAYVVTDILSTPGTWVKATPPSILTSSYGYDDGKSYNNLLPQGFSASAMASLSSTTTPDEIGNYFQIPFAARACGFWFYGDFDNTMTISLLDALNTVLANADFNPNLRVLASYSLHKLFFDSSPAANVTLTTGTWYRMIMTPGASSVLPRNATFPSAAAQGALDGDTSFYQTERTDSGAWTNTTTSRVTMGLIIDQISDGASSGGSGGGLPVLGGSIVR